MTYGPYDYHQKSIFLSGSYKTQTAPNLQRKNWPAIQSCIMCTTNNRETAEHLFIHCPTANALQGPRATPADTSTSGTTTILRKWEGVARANTQQHWTAMAWAIWKEHNRKIFQGESKHLRAMKIKISTYTAQWALCTMGRSIRSNI
jgi:zinc-binding in reverse transcriptase